MSHSTPNSGKNHFFVSILLTGNAFEPPEIAPGRGCTGNSPSANCKLDLKPACTARFGLICHSSCRCSCTTLFVMSLPYWVIKGFVGRWYGVLGLLTSRANQRR